MEEFYDSKNQILIIKYDDIMNREARIPVDPVTCYRLERIRKDSESRIRKLSY